MNHLKKWCQQDIYALAALYYIGATDTEISCVLERSPQSVNKKITRLRLRPKNSETHLIHPGRHLPTFVDIETIQISLHLLLKDILLLTKLSDVVMQLTNHYPFAQTLKSTATVKKHDPRDFLSTDTGQWKSLIDIALFLQKQHIPLEPILDPTGFPVGHTHLIKGHPQRPVDLLLAANKLKEALKEQPFYLDDITQE